MNATASFDEVVALLARVVREVAHASGPPVLHEEVVAHLWKELSALPRAEAERLHRRVWADMLEGFVRTQLGDLVRVVPRN